MGIAVGVIAAIVAVRCLWLAITVWVRNNHHVVIANEVYRSAQLSPRSLARYHARHSYQSVLNLRGAAPGADWYDAELATCQNLGLTHASFRLLSRQVVSPGEVQALLALMHDLPKPMLIHCKRGADRTGFAAAIYLACLARTGLATAGAQLSLRYGHFGIPYLSEAYPMDLSWRRERRALMQSARRESAPIASTTRPA